MRSAISTLVLLTLALNGIVCACPANNGAFSANKGDATHTQHGDHQADKGNATHSQHSGRDTDNAPAENCHGTECQNDCNNECDEVTASKTHRQAAAVNHPQVESEPELDATAIDNSTAESIWPTGSALRILLHIYQRWCADESPVTLKDRMLH